MKIDILAFAAHPDDIELGCSGTLMKQIEAGFSVAIVDLTQGEMGSRGTIETRYEEAAKASDIMGVKTRVNLKMADGLFEINESNKRLIVEQIRKFQPKMVLANAISDRHPDHGRASKLVSEACFLSGLRKYNTELQGQLQEAHRPETVYHYIQDHHISPDIVIDISAFQERKMKAILAYETQFFNPDSKEPETPISSQSFMEFVNARMREFGRPIGAEYGEGFTVERVPSVALLTDLL